ncbi:sugar ABC transporter ATP-binding protein [Rhizosaccharibacter radicis]|uniref:Sugar ABC transporter ATP-binding protein n=1 Tax=Rhizosaccharibacter radicis TaxID=2782605 RepID=A0ABT1W0X1_9PROT|nr:sugar ABC transporter ATP-binding protein [Acetobacteraceae bacterium KSS12]
MTTLSATVATNTVPAAAGPDAGPDAGPHAAGREAVGVEMRNISKLFGGIRALDDVSFSVRPGEVHALLGENGAGKSTLMKVLAGAHQASTGEIRIGGQPVSIPSPHASRALGIGIIYQEMALAPELSVAENIFLGELPPLVSRRRLQERAAVLLRDLGFALDPAALVGSLPLAFQQAVEIAKAMSRQVRILILDEPTAVLAPPEVERLLNVVKTLSRRGVSVVYISHRLDEIFRIADQITVLKDGRTVGTYPVAGMDEHRLISLMVGREASQLFPKLSRTRGAELLRVEGLHAAGLVRDVSLSLHAGEVLGIAGLIGSGRTELARALFGAEPAEKGRILVEGRPVSIRTPRQGLAAGIGLVPEDRKGQGLVLAMPIRQNATLTTLKRFTNPFGVIRRAAERRAVDALARRTTIRARDLGLPVSSLSGGNQQKVVLAKWLDAGCRIVILDEPTRGVDVGARAEIYGLIEQLAANGLGVIVISSDLLEVIGASDRIVVMSGGRISGSLEREEFSEARIMQLALRSAAHVGAPQGGGAANAPEER